MLTIDYALTHWSNPCLESEHESRVLSCWACEHVSTTPGTAVKVPCLPVHKSTESSFQIQRDFSQSGPGNTHTAANVCTINRLKRAIFSIDAASSKGFLSEQRRSSMRMTTECDSFGLLSSRNKAQNMQLIKRSSPGRELAVKGLADKPCRLGERPLPLMRKVGYQM